MGETSKGHGEVSFLADKPAKLDDLGGRDKVANAIAAAFSSEDEGKAIALTGSWGSGKSTVVQMVKNLLEPTAGTPPTSVIVDFDAWCHKGDPLRRAFLIELGDRLSVIGWITEKWWRGSDDTVGKRDEINRRRTVSSTKTTPMLSKGGRVLAVALLLYPVFLAMVTALPGNHRVGLLGIVLTVTLSYVVGLGYLYEWRHSEKKDGKRQVRFFFEERQTDTTTTETRTPDPTSFEFKDYYNKILKKALTDKKTKKLLPGRKLMIVIDNLDRVDHRDAKTIWADQRQLFLRSSDS